MRQLLLNEIIWFILYCVFVFPVLILLQLRNVDLSVSVAPWLGISKQVMIIAFSAVLVLGIRRVVLSNVVDADIQDRQLAGEFERVERNITERLRRDLAVNLGKTFEDQLIKRIIDEKIDDTLINSVDRSLQDRLSASGQIIRVNTIFSSTSELLRRKLDGPAGRSEQNADFARRLAYILAISGILLAGYRIFSGGEFTETVVELIKLGKSNELYILILMQAAPWIGLVALIEFTALMLLRVYHRSIELQRYFTRELTLYEGKIASLIAINEVGTTDQMVAVTKTFLDQESSVQVELAKKS